MGQERLIMIPKKHRLKGHSPFDKIKSIVYDYSGPDGAQRRIVHTNNTLYVYLRVDRLWKIKETYQIPEEPKPLKTHHESGETILKTAFDNEGPNGTPRKLVYTKEMFYTYHQTGNSWKIVKNVNLRYKPE